MVVFDVVESFVFLHAHCYLGTDLVSLGNPLVLVLALALAWHTVWLQYKRRDKFAAASFSAASVDSNLCPLESHTNEEVHKD